MKDSDFVIKCLPFASENVGSRDHHVDLVRAGFYRAPNLSDALSQRRQAGGESGGNRGYTNTAALKRPPRGLDKRVIHTDGRDLDLKTLNSQPLFQIGLNRMPALGTQAAHALVGVIPGERGQVHATDGAEQPRGLPFFFHRATGNLALRPALNRAAIDPDLLHPVEVERNSAVGKKRMSGKRGDGAG